MNAHELSPEELTAVRCVLSRTLFDSQDIEMGIAYSLGNGLALWGRATVTRRGEEGPAPFPDTRRNVGRNGNRAIKRLGVTRIELDEEWRARKLAWHEEATMDDDVLEQFIAPELWPVVACLLHEGPDVACKRLTSAVAILERTPVRKTKARPEGGPSSAAHVAQTRDRIMNLMGKARDLRADGLALPILQAWTFLPPRPAVRAQRAVTDRTAPSRRLCRLVFARYCDHLLARLRADSLEDLPAAVARMSDRQLQGAWCFHTFRTLAMLMVMLVTGTRRGALSRLSRCDVQVDRVCHDGIPRTALAVRPAKGKPWHETYFKPLPHPAGCVIRAWMTYLARVAADPVSDSHPLFPASLVNAHKAQDLSNLTSTFSGRWHVDRTKAAFPRHEDALGAIGRRGPYTKRECTGYSPHALRHAHDQLVEHGAPAYLAALGEHRLSAGVIVKATCDHNMIEDRYSYKDFSNPQGLERLCTMGAEIAWAVLTGRAGARIGLDRPAIEAALRKRGALEAEADRLTGALGDARAEMERVLSNEVGKMTAADFMRMQTQRSRIDLMWDERSELQEALRQVDRELEALQHDPARRVAIADDAPDESVIVDVAALQLAIDGTRAVNGRRVRRLRAWVTLAEFAYIAGVSESEVKRWLDGRFSTRHRGSLPWAVEAIPIEWLSKRRRRILIDGVSADFLAQSGVSDRLEEVLATEGAAPYRRGVAEVDRFDLASAISDDES